MVWSGDHRRGGLCLSGVSDCPGHHLLQSHKEVSVQPLCLGEPLWSPAGLPGPLTALLLSLMIKTDTQLRSGKDEEGTLSVEPLTGSMLAMNLP